MKILIADDDRLVCQSIKTILGADSDIDVAGMAYSAGEAASLYETVLPDIALLDIRMEKERDGIDAAGEILNKHKDAKIVFLTTFADREYISRALAIGARGYLIKQDIESIAPALRAVMAGQRVFGDKVIGVGLDAHGKAPFTHSALSERECRLVELVAKGLSNKEIADRLFLSEGTVRNYLSVILEKLDLRDRTQLAIFYYAP